MDEHQSSYHSIMTKSSAIFYWASNELFPSFYFSHILFFLSSFFLPKLLWQLAPLQSRPPSNPSALHTLTSTFLECHWIRLDLIPTSPPCNNAHVFPSCWVCRHQPTQPFFLIRAIAIVSRYHCLFITLPVSSLFFVLDMI